MNFKKNFSLSDLILTLGTHKNGKRLKYYVQLYTSRENMATFITTLNLRIQTWMEYMMVISYYI